MAGGRPGTSTSPGSSASKPKDRHALAAALYDWCQRNFRDDQVIYQDELLKSGIVPGNDRDTLLTITQTLINDRLLTSREFSSGPLGWLMTSQASAEKYKHLSSDEGLVYRVIESAGRAGAWLKTIKSKLNLHQKNVDSSIKTLLQRGYIKSMATVKYPNRKMYILASLQPNEDATGGAWFTDGVLDQELLEEVSSALEWKISTSSWKLVSDSRGDAMLTQSGQHRKRKEPYTGFSGSSKGKEKVQRPGGEVTRDAAALHREDEQNHLDNLAPEKRLSETKVPKETYVPHPAGYPDYPTLKDLAAFVHENKLMQNGKLAESNISQLLDVMTYDDRIIKITTSDGSSPTKYKARKSVAQLSADRALESRIQKAESGSTQEKRLLRELEIKKLGNGGITELPCGRCPVFDMCQEGGPVNPDNCQYFEGWFQQLENSREEDSGLVW